MANFKNTFVVDFGGTKTSFFFINESNRQGPVFFQKSILAKLPNQINKASKTLIIKSKSAPSLICGMRGVWTKKDKNFWRQKLANKKWRHIQVVSDVELVHALVFGDKPGLVLIAGTGSIAYGKNKMGQIARSGGLGPKRGDEGSGFWMGKEYLLNTNRFKKLNTNQPQAVANLSALALEVLKKAEEKKNSLERKIRNEAWAHLAALLYDVKKKLKFKGTPSLVLHGGLFLNKPFKNGFTRKISQDFKPALNPFPQKK